MKDIRKLYLQHFSKAMFHLYNEILWVDLILPIRTKTFDPPLYVFMRLFSAHTSTWKENIRLATCEFLKLFTNCRESKFCENVLWRGSSESKSTVMGLVDWGPTSRWGSFGERSPFCSSFSTSVFREIPGTVPESVRTCGFRRNSSSLDRAAKMRNSVLQSPLDNFLVTLPLISSETCVI